MTAAEAVAQLTKGQHHELDSTPEWPAAHAETPVTNKDILAIKYIPAPLASEQARVPVLTGFLSGCVSKDFFL